MEELVKDLPISILLESPANKPILKSQNPNRWKQQLGYDTQTLEVHLAADSDDNRLEKLAAENERILHLKDKNGWQPIHEAALAGHIDVVEFLVGKGVGINALAHYGEGDNRCWQVITLFPNIS